MNHLLNCLLAFSLCATTGLAQRANDVKSPISVATSIEVQKQLELTTTIVRRWSCGPGSLSLTLKLSFRNAGTESIILSKRILMGRIMVSRNLDDAAAKKYSLSLRYTEFAGENEPGFGFNTPTDLSGFVVLRPKEVYESEESISIPTRLVALPGTKPLPEVDLSDGTHLLQIEVGSWPYVADPAPIRQSWKDKGYLWTRGLLSTAMSFTVKKDEPVTKCPASE